MNISSVRCANGVGSGMNGTEVVEKRRIIESWMTFYLRSSPVDFTYVVIVRAKNYSFSTRGYKTSNEAIIEAYEMVHNEVHAVVGRIERNRKPK